MLARGTASIAIGLILRALLQAAIFIIVSRTLGVTGYGAFAATLALAAFFGCFGALGTQTIMLREISLAPGAFASSWGRVLTAIAINSPVQLLVYLILASWILPSEVSTGVILLIGVAEVILTPIFLSAVPAYQGHERMGRAAWLTLVPVIPRCLAAIGLVALTAIIPPKHLLLVWSTFYVFSSLCAAIYAQWLVLTELGSGRWPEVAAILRAIRKGLPFAASAAVLKVHTDIDKTMVARLSTLEAAGGYSAGHRVVDLLTIPIISLLTATWPRFFRAASGHKEALFDLTLRILPAPLIYAVLVGLGLYYFADFILLVLGSGYAIVSSVLRWLAWLPLISLPRLLLQTIMFSTERQLTASLALSAGAVANVGLNLWLIPAYGWRGAVVSTYVAEIVIAVTLVYFFRSGGLSNASR